MASEDESEFVAVFDGGEVYRAQDAVASADWIAAEYATVASDTFVTAGDIEDVGAKLGMAIFVR